VTALASETGRFRRNPAKRNSSIVGGSGALAEYIDGGSAPRAMHTVHPLAPLSHVAPVRRPHLWRCQMHRQRVLACLHDAIHADVPDSAFGSRVITIGIVM